MRRRSAYQSRMLLVMCGLMLGYLARVLLGPPASESPQEYRLDPVPLPEATVPSDEIS